MPELQEQKFSVTVKFDKKDLLELVDLIDAAKFYAEDNPCSLSLTLKKLVLKWEKYVVEWNSL